jgi:hypothetical protein
MHEQASESQFTAGIEKSASAPTFESGRGTCGCCGETSWFENAKAVAVWIADITLAIAVTAVAGVVLGAALYAVLVRLPLWVNR